MAIRFYLLAALLKNILALSPSDASHPGSNFFYGSVNFPAPATKPQPDSSKQVGFKLINDCPYNTTFRTPFVYDSSSCVNLARENSAGTQFPSVDEFAKNFTDTVLSLPRVQRFLQMDLPGSEISEIVYNMDFKLLKDLGHPMPEFPVTPIARALDIYSNFSLPVYFKIVANLID